VSFAKSIPRSLDGRKVATMTNVLSPFSAQMSSEIPVMATRDYYDQATFVRPSVGSPAKEYISHETPELHYLGK